MGKTHINDVKEKIIQAVIDETFFRLVDGPATHIGKHVIEDEVEVLDRILASNGSAKRHSEEQKKNKSINSGFGDLDKAYWNIEEGVIQASGDIAEWLEGSENGDRTHFSVELPPEDYEPVGYGYVVSRDDNTIDEYETNTVRIVVEKNSSMPLGFSVVTAYPDIIDEQNRTPTGRDLSELAKQTSTYQNASSVSRAYIAYQTGTIKPYLGTFKEGYHGNVADDVFSIHIPFKTKNGDECRHVIRIKDDRAEIVTQVMSDVHILKRKGQRGEKVIYPGEDLSKYQDDAYKRGDSVIYKDKRFIPRTSHFTRAAGCTPNDKGLRADLNNPKVMSVLMQKFPDAATIVNNSLSIIDEYHGKTKQATVKQPRVELNQSLLPKQPEDYSGLNLTSEIQL